MMMGCAAMPCVAACVRGGLLKQPNNGGRSVQRARRRRRVDQAVFFVPRLSPRSSLPM